jgi:hypothetical protein
MRPGHQWRYPRDLLIPATFWTKGWVGHLPAPELIGLLGLFDRGADRRDVVMRGRLVEAFYGITGETWRTSATNLARLGLIEQRVAVGTTQSYRYRIVPTRIRENAPAFP